ncbi:MAG: uncharacterized membrane protein YsdA (DUF1294 family) [Pseudohongiellaceae bacterium]|jgi:uncharacterized membrane protein YsdA (DUF1294 family)
MSFWSQPLWRFGLLGLGSSLGLTFLLSGLNSEHSLPVWVAWLISVSLVTFLIFGYDKAICKGGWMRVPENTLLLLVATGGTVGALAAMNLFRHKTVKASFRNRFWVAVGIQLLVLAGWFGRDYVLD